ncbi:phosphoribosylglycinamide formyltransferase [Marinihelvus fidelis]|uniref:Phosphoribosylglycinamide formyltransferase n=1 Tax=Marinihelvus fidelis TaxID=2613842 RepID=A0A5N0TE84_9GAMM|nr:phosphoribosylglycinamide formyltransferase [Marinihelvus fidelis]KAA9133413.1 phosphoribosylglycinamide formyltransferase [Marinihelvus fidelis]
MSSPLRVAVLISGTGSNLKSLLDARDAGRLDLDFVRVISNRANAPGLAHARAANIPWSVIDKASAGDVGQDRVVGDTLAADAPDLVLLSGYMRILGAELVDRFEGRMINQHPSLLPKYKGLHTYQRALDAGDSEHGASVHFVTSELDGGPVIAQVRIGVQADDDATSLAARLRPLEHRLLEEVMALFTQRRVTMDGEGVRVDDRNIDQPLQWTPEGWQA